MSVPRNYNKLTLKQRRIVREEYVKIQKGICIHCGNSLDRPAHESVRNLSIDLTLFPPTFFNSPVHLHHNHKTGMTIGAIHAHCNAVLWQYYGE